MAKSFQTFLSSLLVCLVLAATAAYFKNTEAFLNGRHHFDKSRHHDYDHNGKKESTHHKHGSPLVMAKLTFVTQVSQLVVVQIPFSFESSPVYEDGILKPEDYKSAIFKPPILA